MADDCRIRLLRYCLRAIQRNPQLEPRWHNLIEPLSPPPSPPDPLPGGVTPLTEQGSATATIDHARNADDTDIMNISGGDDEESDNSVVERRLFPNASSTAAGNRQSERTVAKEEQQSLGKRPRRSGRNKDMLVGKSWSS